MPAQAAPVAEQSARLTIWFYILMGLLALRAGRTFAEIFILEEREGSPGFKAEIKSRWREAVAITVAAIIIGGGIYLAVTVQEVWLNRAGALVIIVGVILAASRVNEIISAKVAGFVERNFDINFAETLTSLELELNEKLSPERISEIKHRIHRDLLGELGSLLDERKRMFKLYEVALLVVGTFLNGFGDWLVCLFK